jgi:hypothetical protein
MTLMRADIAFTDKKARDIGDAETTNGRQRSTFLAKSAVINK